MFSCSQCKHLRRLLGCLFEKWNLSDQCVLGALFAKWTSETTTGRLVRKVKLIRSIRYRCLIAKWKLSNHCVVGFLFATWDWSEMTTACLSNHRSALRSLINTKVKQIVMNQRLFRKQTNGWIEEMTLWVLMCLLKSIGRGRPVADGGTPLDTDSISNIALLS